MAAGRIDAAGTRCMHHSMARIDRTPCFLASGQCRAFDAESGLALRPSTAELAMLPVVCRLRPVIAARKCCARLHAPRADDDAKSGSYSKKPDCTPQTHMSTYTVVAGLMLSFDLGLLCWRCRDSAVCCRRRRCRHVLSQQLHHAVLVVQLGDLQSGLAVQVLGCRVCVAAQE